MESRRQACAGHSHGDRCESSDRRSFACIGRSVSVQQFVCFYFPSFLQKKQKGTHAISSRSCTNVLSTPFSWRESLPRIFNYAKAFAQRPSPSLLFFSSFFSLSLLFLFVLLVLFHLSCSSRPLAGTRVLQRTEATPPPSRRLKFWCT